MTTKYQWRRINLFFYLTWRMGISRNGHSPVNKFVWYSNSFSASPSIRYRNWLPLTLSSKVEYPEIKHRGKYLDRPDIFHLYQIAQLYTCMIRKLYMIYWIHIKPSGKGKTRWDISKSSFNLKSKLYFLPDIMFSSREFTLYVHIMHIKWTFFNFDYTTTSTPKSTKRTKNKSQKLV
jgi:hypothetical protein